MPRYFKPLPWGWWRDIEPSTLRRWWKHFAYVWGLPLAGWLVGFFVGLARGIARGTAMIVGWLIGTVLTVAQPGNWRRAVELDREIRAEVASRRQGP